MIDNEKVDKAFDKIDTVLVDVFNTMDLTFEEIHLIMWRLQRKVWEQEMTAFHQYMHPPEQKQKSEDSTEWGMYR